jgi:hypothetical protein
MKVIRQAIGTLEIHFLFFRNEFRAGTYLPEGGTEIGTPFRGVGCLAVSGIERDLLRKYSES